ncbi:hypothetical protein ACFQWF_16365 [Methylorubrum suomiense]
MAEKSSVLEKLSPCSKEEIAAWEAYGQRAGLDMHEHPLHYLFPDAKTNAARQGWKAGIAWALALLADDPPSERAAEERRVSLADCPIGLFLAVGGALCLKTEYADNEGRVDAYIVESGEFFGAVLTPLTNSAG